MSVQVVPPYPFRARLSGASEQAAHTHPFTPFFFQTGQQCSGGPHGPGAGSEIASTTEGPVVSVFLSTPHTEQ